MNDNSFILGSYVAAMAALYFILCRETKTHIRPGGVQVGGKEANFR